MLLEEAIESRLGRPVDYGIDTGQKLGEDSIKVLKMHGSFGWRNEWPIANTRNYADEMWIPPGIRKSKVNYPFNVIWGQARELLNCDVLRLIGCNLGPNDWDLVSLIFNTMHTHELNGPFRVEVVSSPATAKRIQENHPYLHVVSLLELPMTGELMTGEVLGSGLANYTSLSDDGREVADSTARAKYRNAFYWWLVFRGEAMTQAFGDLTTPSGVFQDFVDSTS